MQKTKILFILGVLVVLLPYLGFPYAIKNILITLAGLGVIFFTYFIYSENKNALVKEKEEFENFSENNDFLENKAENI